MTIFAESEMLFGSCSRGDSDELSDRDILIADSNPSILRERSNELKKEGWSVASCTFSKIEHLVSIGALFVQHLKLEGKIIRDEDGKLSCILREFKPKLNYEYEIETNNELLLLASCRPASVFGLLWSLDFLYVAIRNWGILKLAGMDCHKYSYKDIIIELVERGIISKDAVEHLIKLRFMKSLYRSSEIVPAVYTRNILDGIIESLPRELRVCNFVELDPREILKRNFITTNYASAYHRLRNMERSCIALKSLIPCIQNDKLFEKMDAWIKNPRAYANFAISKERELNDLIEGLLFKMKGVDSKVSFG